MKPRNELNEPQEKMLAWLERNGAVSPSRLLAQTYLPPEEAWNMLKQLEDWELVIMREDSDSPDGMLVVATPTASKKAS